MRIELDKYRRYRPPESKPVSAATWLLLGLVCLTATAANMAILFRALDSARPMLGMAIGLAVPLAIIGLCVVQLYRRAAIAAPPATPPKRSGVQPTDGLASASS